MLKIIENFGYGNLEDMCAAGWSATTDNRLVRSGNGTTLRMSSAGTGFFVSMLGLPGRYESGTLGFSTTFGSGGNVLNAVFLDGTQERLRVSLTGSGGIKIISGGKQIAQTSGGSFVGRSWSYIELSLDRGHNLTAAVGGNAVLIGKQVHASFDRIAFSLPDDQRSWTDIGDLYFDDGTPALGERTAFVLPESGLSYVPAAVFGIRTGNAVLGDNNGVPWTYRDISAMAGSTVMVSCKRTAPPQHSHSGTIQ